MISSCWGPENRSIGSVRVLGLGSEIDVIWLESIFSLGDGSHNLLTEDFLLPGGRIIHICTRLRKAHSGSLALYRHTCNLEGGIIIMMPSFQMIKLRLRDLTKLIQLSM